MPEVAQNRDFNNLLDCPRCQTGGTVRITRSWKSTLNEAMVHVKWECFALRNGIKCDYRHWEQIEHPQEIETTGLPVRLQPYKEQPVYTGGSYFGKCPRCQDENTVLHDFRHPKHSEMLRVCVRCCTEMSKLYGPDSLTGELVPTSQTDIIRVSSLIPDPEKLDTFLDPKTALSRSVVRGKVKCEMCGNFVQRVFDVLNTWVCKACKEVCDEPDGEIVRQLRRGME